ncbi:MAG: metalloenzyme [Gemmatimonadota bacterium]|nr:MAG: metalloenzyme [Gemmatimonadota bacterium]
MAEPAGKPGLMRMLGRRPDPQADNHLVFITIDSCRWDTFLEARPENIARPFGGIDAIERRISYAPWTAPSHYNLLMGLLPHRSPKRVYASEHYKRDFVRYNERLGTRESQRIDFGSLIPQMWLPSFLQYKLGYSTHAMVSLPVLNRATPINSDFDRYKLMDEHNDMGKMLDRIEAGEVFDDERPSFLLMNTGETHYPYTIPGDDPEDLPPLFGPHGILRPVTPRSRDQAEPDPQNAGASGTTDADGSGERFEERVLDEAEMIRLRERQVRAVRHLDKVVFPRLYDILPRNTWVVVMSDHGELFGEGGYFGHGPILHDKVLEVPFLEGRLR